MFLSEADADKYMIHRQEISILLRKSIPVSGVQVDHHPLPVRLAIMIGTLRQLPRSLLIALLLAAASCFLFVTASQAQDSGGQVVISSSETGNAPSIILRAYAVDDQGGSLELTSDNVILLHDGVPVEDITITGNYEAGTFTVFVVDIPGGLEGQLDSIQNAIEQFSSPPNMKERADFVAIYRVGETDASQLLAPTNFYNTVRNFFATPLEAATEQTALADSVGNLLGEIPSILPKTDMVASIVLITDGTDVVSTDFDLEDLGGSASQLGIPIHTVWIQNEQLLPITQNEGRQYLSQLAAETGALSARLDTPDELQRIWDRIISFRNHQVIEYLPENLSGGESEVVLSLRENPEVRDSISVNIPETAPTVQIILPEESRQINLETLEEPVRLVFSTSVSWLDGIEREIVSAELLVNRIPVEQIEVDELDRFTAEVNYFSYGPNDIQIQIVDELEQTATSPTLTLTVLEGATSLPDEMQPAGITDSTIFRIVLGCLIIFLVVALVIVLIRLVRRLGIGSRRGRPRRRQLETGTAAGAGLQGSAGYPMDQGEEFREIGMEEQALSGTGAVPRGQNPYLEFLSSVTRMPSVIELSAVEHRIGRSPVQADIVLENDITVSRLHASIVLEGTDYRIYDEGSSSGTWVNGQQVPDFGYQLIDGDEIRLGDALIRYRR